ncbi:hypothetical protein MIMGU_mgv1a007167mg [Erythranthe guttata]|uniref:Uncharacterized protein n=1 Tax=Erythranthe guttata TaxID=4155 RepID=A0A022R0K0_ERYGU|nr:hypothetical protein MIMGU_mgv1a007167mg [Erythranthe guttata]
MASACVNNIGISPESFLDCTPVKCPSYGWLSPRISFSRELPDEEAASNIKPSAKNQARSDNAESEKPKGSDPVISGKDFVDFEFHLEDPVKMLAADELFSDGKLVPLHLSTIRQSMTSAPESSDVRSADDSPYFRQRKQFSSTDTYLFSPKAPTCSSRWKGLLGLKKLYGGAKQDEADKTASSSSSSSHHNSSHNKTAAARSLKHLLHRGSKSALNASEPTDNESLSVSSRLSLSSSSSGHEYDELPRLSLDSDKPTSTNIPRLQIASNLSKVRVAKHRAAPPSSENPTAASTRVGRSPMRRAPESAVPARDVSVDSPRMNSSGKVVFHSLERSSSSPSTFNGGPRHKHGGVERSYSANVRISTVLNVPVCSIRGSSKSGAFGFPLFSSSSQQKKDINPNRSRQHHQISKNRTDRT